MPCRPPAVTGRRRCRMHWPCLSGLGEAASRCSTSGMSSYYNGSKSNHFDGERFFDREVEYAWTRPLDSGRC
jgi:hypothetical protein